MSRLGRRSPSPQHCLAVGLLALALGGCGAPAPAAPPAVAAPDLDAETQALIAGARRAAFLVPFSHWDTDWHDSFANYVQRSDGNILAAIRMAQAEPRFRYALEQVLFVQRFWETYPEHRAALTAAVQRRQLTFAWAGWTQPETSLVAPAVQVRNLQLGREWIAETFGPDHVPRAAWQSDAFGNSAAFPMFLAAFEIPYLLIGRWQHRCDPDFEDCEPLPHAFYWRSPAGDARVLTAYLSYPGAWDAIHRLPGEAEQVAALRAYVEAQFERTDSRYVFIPFGSDFIDPMPNLPSLVERWNRAGGDTALVMAGPDTAFRYLETQPLPEITVDLNPIWQAFYVTRPYAKVADKEAEYLLTAADKFGWLLGAPESAAWPLAATSAHYDNISGVGYDWVWEASQRPRYEQTLEIAASDLAARLLRIAAGATAGGAPAEVLVFNPLSWARSEVVEVAAPEGLPDPALLPGQAQTLGPDSVAFLAGGVPAVGFSAPSVAGGGPPASAVATQSGGLVHLANGLVSASLDPARGGALASLSVSGGPELLAGYGDDVVLIEDGGDVYGARFGAEIARASRAEAQVAVLAEGPLLARVQVALPLAGEPITRTVSLRAGSPLLEVALQIAALPESTALLQTQTTLAAERRTDDLGFAAYEHEVDTRPIQPGDVTYRRDIFYPFMAWSDVSAGGAGLTLITHGMQGLSGAGHLSLLLARQVSDEGREGVTDAQVHTLRYAYMPHQGTAPESQPWLAAYAFNQPLIVAWRRAGQVCVQLPFGRATAGDGQVVCQAEAALGAAGPFVAPFSLLSAEGGIVAGLRRRAGGAEALVLGYDPQSVVTISAGGRQYQTAGPFPRLVPLELP